MNEYTIRDMKAYFKEISELNTKRIFFDGYPNEQAIEGGYFSEKVQIGKVITKEGSEGTLSFNIRTGELTSGMFADFEKMEDFKLKENWIEIIENKFLELQNRFLEKELRVVCQMAEIQEYVEHLRNDTKEDELEEIEEIED